MWGRLSSQIKVDFPFTEADIGGTNTAGSSDAVQWLDMANYDTFMAIVELGTWNAGDDLDTCKLEQATSSAGAGKKDLTTCGSGATYDYDTDNPVDADGNQVVLECRAEDLDVDNDFHYVRVYCAETGNTGTDNVSAVCIRSAARLQEEHLQGAPSTGAQVYVTPA